MMKPGNRNNSRLNILIVSPTLPYPPTWGFGIRVLQMIRLLARRHRVTLIAHAEGDAAEGERGVREAGAVAVHTLPLPGGSKRRAQLQSLFQRRSFQRSSLHSPQMQALITQTLRSETFDLVQIESSQMAGFDFGDACPLILDEHNIEYELLDRMRQTERMLTRRVYNGAEFVKFRQEEQACWKRVAGCLFTSEREAAIAQKIAPNTPIHVAPNGVDIERFHPSSVIPDPDRLAFTGLMNYRPNTDGALYFVNEILPRILKTRAGVQFDIVGAYPTPEIEGLAAPHIRVTGLVPDVRPYVEQAAAVVVPLRMGGGTRLKALEALASGKPMVSTSLGIEGIAVVHNEHLLIADGAENFADAVTRLLSDADLRRQFAANGRRLAEERYSWTSVVDDLEKFYERILAGGFHKG